MPYLTRAEYLTALRTAERIMNPTPEQVLAVCPHLTEGQVGDFMREGGGQIALPPVRIRHSYQYATYYPGGYEGGSAPFFSAHGSGCRTPQSYADGVPRNDTPVSYRFAAEAMAYAETHWPGELILDSWASFLTVYVQDPTDQTERGRPNTTATIYVCLERGWNQLVNDRAKPDWAVWNDAIVHATLDPFEAGELQGGRGGFTEYNCAHCGGGLWLSSCCHCRKTFTGSEARGGWRTPLAPKLVRLLRDNGHVFAIDPDRLFQQVEV